MTEYLVLIAVLGLFVLFVFWQGYQTDKRNQRLFVKKLTGWKGQIPDKEYKIERFLRIRAFYEKHQEEFQIDDITWNDLNMDDVFKRMNYCLSSTGEEYLYYLLRTPKFQEEELKHFDAIAEYYAKEDAKRLDFQLLMNTLGNTGKYSLYDYIGYLTGLGIRSNKMEWIRNLLLIAAIGTMWIQLSIGIVAIVVWMLFQIFDYYKKKAEIEPYTVSLAYLMRMLSVADRVKVSLPQICSEEQEAIEQAADKLKKSRTGSFWLFNSGSSKTSGSPLDIVLDYFRMIFHVDLIVFNRMLSELILHLEDVDILVSKMGYLESAVSVGLFRESLTNGCCKPEFSKAGISIVDGYHPLITAPVKNSLSAGKSVLLTGSNASGKSTFLKMMAINALMAQTIYTVAAASYNAAFCRLYSSMSLKDDLENNESYYIVEIKSIKRIMDSYKEGGSKILCFVDEVLRGTNTVERIAASTQILNSMSGEDIQCFAATHDIELTHLLEDVYDNYHFEEEIKDGDVLFNYQLKKGRATTRNAIKLLEIIGYERNIISKAQRQADIFLKEGIWNRP